MPNELRSTRLAPPPPLHCPVCGRQVKAQGSPGLYMGQLRLGYLCPDCLKQRPSEAAVGVLQRVAQKQAQADRARLADPAGGELVRVLERSVDHLNDLASHLERIPSWTEQPPIQERHPRPNVLRRQAGVLVVDEDPEVQGQLRRLLGQHGYQTWQAQSGRLAVEVMRQHHKDIDLALLDAHTRGGEGAWVVAEMRRHNPRLICCFLGADRGEYSARMLRNLGVAAQFEKPLDVGGLIGVLRQLLPA